MSFETLFIPLIVLAVLLSVLIAIWLFSRNYIKVSPNAAAVFSGRKRKLSDGRVVGYRIVRGGAALRVPLLEKVEYLSLNLLTIPLEIRRAYTVKGVPVSVKAVANVKIKSDDVSLQAAAERFLGMSLPEVQKVIFQTLEGHLRAILGTLTVEEINNDRQSFAQKLTSEAAADLERMGIGVDVLIIQEISDEEGYLDALGKRRTAEVKRDAQIGEAEATRDSKITVQPRHAGRGEGQAGHRCQHLARASRSRGQESAVSVRGRARARHGRAGGPALRSQSAASGRG